MAPPSRLHLLLTVIAVIGLSWVCQGARLPTQESGSAARGGQESGNGRGLDARVWIAASTKPGPEYRAETDDDDEGYREYQQQGPYGHDEHDSNHYEDHQGPYGYDRHEQYSHDDTAHDYNRHKQPYSSHDEHDLLEYRGYAAPKYGQGNGGQPGGSAPFPLPADRQHQLGLVHHGPYGDHGEHDPYHNGQYEHHTEYQGPQPDQHGSGPRDGYQHHEGEFKDGYQHEGQPKDGYQHEGPRDGYQHGEGPKDNYQHEGPRDAYQHGEGPKDNYQHEGPYDTKGPGPYDGHNTYEPAESEPHEDQYHEPEHEPYPEDKHEETVKICLHESFRGYASGDSSSAFSSVFQCCTSEDAPGACLLGNTTDGYPYPAKKPPQKKKSSFVGDILNPDQAAVCTWTYVPSLCPPHLLETCLGSGSLNCTLSSTASECGCPFKTLSFTAQGWFIGCDALSCEQSYAPELSAKRGVGTKHSTQRRNAGTPAAVFTGTAWIFKGHVTHVVNADGYQQGAEGDVEFVTQFGAPEGLNSGGRQLLEAATATPAPQAAPAVSTKPSEQPKKAPASAAAPLDKAQPAPAAAAAPAAQPAQQVQQPKPTPATDAKPAPVATQATAKPAPVAAQAAPATGKQQVHSAPVPTKAAPRPAKSSHAHLPFTLSQPVEKPKKAPVAQAPNKPAANKAPTADKAPTANNVPSAKKFPAVKRAPGSTPPPASTAPVEAIDLPLVRGGKLKVSLALKQY